MLFDAIDFDYQPETYWLESLSQEQLLARVMGQDRRVIARELLRKYGFEALGHFLARPELTDNERQAWGFRHPSHMGGEYLPSLKESEVEIARISLESVTADQISLRACPENGEISYRIVDEYETEYIPALPRSSSPLTFAQLIMQVDETDHAEGEMPGGLLVGFWDEQFEHYGKPHEAVTFARIESAYYPALGEYYRLRSRQWRARKFLEIRRRKNATRRQTRASPEPAPVGTGGY